MGSFPGFSPDHHLPQTECRMLPDAFPPWLSDRPGWALESLIPREAGLWSQRFSGWPRCHVGSAWPGLFPVPCLGLQKAPGVVSRRVSKVLRADCIWLPLAMEDKAVDLTRGADCRARAPFSGRRVAGVFQFCCVCLPLSCLGLPTPLVCERAAST